MTVAKSDQDFQVEIKERQKSLAKLLVVEKPKEILPMGHPLKQYTGVFENALYGIFNLSEDGKDLLVEAGPGKWKGKLQHLSNDTFVLSWPLINSGNQHVTFVFGPENNVIEFQTEAFGTFYKKK
jgi:hypothetical protein